LSAGARRDANVTERLADFRALDGYFRETDDSEGNMRVLMREIRPPAS
jgi:hypothetical protein